MDGVRTMHRKMMISTCLALLAVSLLPAVALAQEGTAATPPAGPASPPTAADSPTAGEPEATATTHAAEAGHARGFTPTIGVWLALAGAIVALVFARRF